MSRKNGGIIGPANTPVGGLFKGVAGGVWRMNDVANFVGNSQWPKTPQNIDNSLRFNDGSTDYLHRTPSSAGNRKTFTISTWIKRGALLDGQIIMSGADTNNRTSLVLSSNKIFFRNEVSGTDKNITTNRLFRDTSAWYHFVLAVDTTQSTEANRVRIYVNGSEETSFSSSSYPSQNDDTFINNSQYTE